MGNRIDICLALHVIAVMLNVILVTGIVRAAECVKPEEPGDRRSQEHRRSGEVPSLSARSYRTNPRCAMMATLPGLMDQRRTFLTDPVFSFIYNEKDSAELLGTWKRHRESRGLDAHRTQRTLTWTDSKTGLEVRKVGIEYDDFPAVEWTVYFKNTGSANTPILKNIQALDVILERDGEANSSLTASKATGLLPRVTNPIGLRSAQTPGRSLPPQIIWGNRLAVLTVGRISISRCLVAES